MPAYRSELMADDVISDGDLNDLLGGKDPLEQIVAEMPSSRDVSPAEVAPEAVEAGSDKTNPMAPTSAYVFGREPQIPTAEMPSLAAANGRLVKALLPRWRKIVMRPMPLAADVIKVMTYSQMLDQMSEPVYFSLISLKPLQGQGLLCIGSNLVVAAVDHLFGGSGRFPTAVKDRVLSPSERRLADRLMQALTTSVKESMQDLCPIDAQPLLQDSDLKAHPIAAPDDFMVVTDLAATLGEEHYPIRIAFPYLSLEPIRHTLRAPQRAGVPINHQRWMDLLLEQVQQADVELVAELATANATVAQLMSLKVGDFIEVDLKQSLMASIANVPVLHCGYGISNGRYAIRVHDFLTTPTVSDKENAHVR